MTTSRGKRPIANLVEPPTPTFTADDLVSALSSLATREQVAEGLTAQEWIEVTGWTKNKVDRTLSALHRAKRLKVGKVLREARDLSMRQVSTYAVAPK